MSPNRGRHVTRLRSWFQMMCPVSVLDKSSWAGWLAVVALLLILFGQQVFGSMRLSLTSDEPIHISLGYTRLMLGDCGEMPVHEPPLINQWTAWPLLWRPDHPDPRQLPAWESNYPPYFGAQLLSRLGPIEAVELAARLPIMLLSLLLAAVIYRWAADLFGRRAGLLALFLCAFDPNIIAHSQLATTDIGGLTFGLLATFAAWRATRRPTPGRIVLTGVALGLAVAAKVSGLFYVLMIGLLIGCSVLSNGAGRRGGAVLRWGVCLLAIYGLAFGVFWAVYRFEVGTLPEFPFPVPAPTHVRVLQAFSEHNASGHWAFLAGRVGERGWWWYFPLALLIKTPLPVLLLLPVAVVVGLRSRFESWIDDVWLLAPPLVYFSSSLFSTINIGYRHLFPLLPFLYIFISRLATFSWQGLERAIRCMVRFACCALALWYALGTVCVFPHYLAFFNELVGGPDGGYRYLADSNTDWGQALKELAAYQQAEGIEQVKLSALSHIDPAVYGVRYEPLSPTGGAERDAFFPQLNPPPGDYVFSASTLQGIGLTHPETYDWFRKRTPDAIIGHVMFVHRVPRGPERTWVAQCATTATPLDYLSLAYGFGRGDLRFVGFDCSQSWLYPAGGEASGWFVLAGQPPAWTNARLEHLRLSCEQQYAGDSSPVHVYEYDAGPVLDVGLEKRVRLASSEAMVDLPLSFEHGLALLGHALDQSVVGAGDTVALETAWRVEGIPDRAPTLVARLLSPDGRELAASDGFGVPVEVWQPGDVFVQRHTLSIPESAAAGMYELHLSVCWRGTEECWMAGTGHITDDQLLLATVEVR
jgi:hypothetical protein